MQVRLVKSLGAWSTDAFEPVLLEEVASLGIANLPLQQGLKWSSVALDHQLQLSVLSVQSEKDVISVKLAAFYTGIIAGCSCADDPSPQDEMNEYCEFVAHIDALTGQAEFQLIS